MLAGTSTEGVLSTLPGIRPSVCLQTDFSLHHKCTRRSLEKPFRSVAAGAIPWQDCLEMICFFFLLWPLTEKKRGRQRPLQLTVFKREAEVSNCNRIVGGFVIPGDITSLSNNQYKIVS